MKLFNKEIILEPLDIDDNDIVAMFDGSIIVEKRQLGDPIFSQEQLGQTIAFNSSDNNVVICSPANGKVSYIFPDNQSFIIETNNNLQLFIRIGTTTDENKGNRLDFLDVKPGQSIKAGDPIIKLDMKKSPDTPVILVLTNNDNKKISFIKNGVLNRGDSLLKKNWLFIISFNYQVYII